MVTTPLLAIEDGPLRPEQLAAAVGGHDEANRSASGHAGAVATFLWLVRNHNAGRLVRYGASAFKSR